MRTVTALHDGGLGARTILSFAGLDLVVAPGDLRLIETVADLVRRSPPANGVGWISAFDQTWPVYALSFDLQPLAELPEDRRMCALLGHASGIYGLLCSDIRVMREAGSPFHPLPAAMRPVGSPIRTLAVGPAGILCGTEAGLLAGHIGVEPVAGEHQITAGVAS